MTENLAQKARENRQAALAMLIGRTGEGDNVVSLRDRVFKPRSTVPQFHSTRARPRAIIDPHPQPLLILTDPVAA